MCLIFGICSENDGLLRLTLVGSRQTLQRMIFFSILGDNQLNLGYFYHFWVCPLVQDIASLQPQIHFFILGMHWYQNHHFLLFYITFFDTNPCKPTQCCNVGLTLHFLDYFPHPTQCISLWWQGGWDNKDSSTTMGSPHPTPLTQCGKEGQWEVL